MRRLNRKGQSTAEYAIVIGLVIAAVIAMQTYVRRGMSGKVRLAVDNISAATGGTTVQYEPYYSHSDYDTQTEAYEMTEATGQGEAYERHQGIGGGSERRSTRTGTAGVHGWTQAD